MKQRTLFYAAAATFASGAGYLVKSLDREEKNYDELPPALNLNGRSQWSSIIVGGGTAGCLSAYFLAKWMEEHDIPGNVLLIERGQDHKNTSPLLKDWYNNWGSFTVAHESRHKSGHYPITPTEHVGLGGCSTHDTRICFMPTEQERQDYARALGISPQRFNIYTQMALNIEPTIPVAGKGEKYFDRVIKTLIEKGAFSALDNNYFFGHVKPGIGYVSVGAYKNSNDDANYSNIERWHSALLLNENTKPKNLTILCAADVEQVLLHAKHWKNSYRASGVIIQTETGKYSVSLEANGHLTVAAGALGTPALLQRSGVGDAKALKNVNIAPFIDVSEIGHGVDHEEIAVTYQAPNRWPDDIVPSGGVTGWPLVIFKRLDEISEIMQAHFSLSGPPYSDGIKVVATPNNSQPDLSAGYRVFIQSKKPRDPLLLKFEDSAYDSKAFLAGVREVIRLFDILQEAGLVGERESPAIAGEIKIDIDDDEALWNWIAENKGTAYHWLATCKAGIQGIIKPASVVDENFKLRIGNDSKHTIHNLFITSGAVLPFPPRGNPHVTIQIFAIMQAHHAFIDLCNANNHFPIPIPAEYKLAQEQVMTNTLQARDAGEEIPRGIKAQCR